MGHIDMSDIALADLVVIGSVRNYEIIEDTKARALREEICTKNKDLDQRFCNQPRIFSDYAQFEIEVHSALKGTSPNVVTVTLDNSTFGAPTSLGGKHQRFLVTLRAATSKIPPLRGPSAFIAPNPDPDLLTVLQAPCAPSFIFRYPERMQSRPKMCWMERRSMHLAERKVRRVFIRSLPDNLLREAHEPRPEGPPQMQRQRRPILCDVSGTAPSESPEIGSRKFKAIANTRKNLPPMWEKVSKVIRTRLSRRIGRFLKDQSSR